jgi:signal transduction histidine kinase/CheY-like chemotaxis protein
MYGSSKRFASWTLAFTLLVVFFEGVPMFRPELGLALGVCLLVGRQGFLVVLLGGLFASFFLESDALLLLARLGGDLAQVAVAYTIVRRRFPSGVPQLYSLRDLIRFELVSGPLGALGGTLAAFTIYQLPILTIQAAPTPREWVLLFIGRTLGGALFTPLVLALICHEHPWERRRLSVAVPSLVSLLMIFFGRFLVQRQYERFVEATVEQRAQDQVQAVQHKLTEYSEVLFALNGLWERRPELRQDKFEDILSTLSRQDSTPEVFVLAPLVADDARDGLEEAFAFKEIDPQGGLIEAARRDFYRPVSLVYPSTRQLELKGLDLLSLFDKALWERLSRGEPVLCSTSLGRSGERKELLWLIVGNTRTDEKTGPFIAGLLDPAKLFFVEESRTQPFTHAATKVSVKPSTPETRAILSLGQLPSEAEIVVDKEFQWGGMGFGVSKSYVIVPESRPMYGLPLALLVLCMTQIFFMLLSTRSIRVEQLKAELEQRADSLKKLNQRLRIVSKEAQAASRARTLFLANISHEIRTPMHGILGLSKLLLQSDFRLAQQEQLRHVVLSAEGLLHILNDVLDFSFIEGQELELFLQPCDLDELLEEVLRTVSLHAEEKELELYLAIGEDVPPTVVVDKVRLRQVLLNLVGNAVKFTGEGEVRLEVSAEEKVENDVFLRFAVKDTGIGIPPSLKQQIFEAFSQGRPSTSGTHHGTGLGLTISRHLVELMGGILQVESVEGEGSVFYFSLRCPMEPLSEGRRSRIGSGNVVMVKVQNSGRRREIERVLESLGCTVARDDSKADVAIVEENRMEKPGDTPVIALLGLRRLAKRCQQCEDLGIVPLIRPVTQKSLKAALEVALGAKVEASTGGFSRKTARSYLGKKALVVDDNSTNVLLACLLLENLGFQVSSVNNGLDAVETLKQEEFHLLVMDMKLPRLDGFSAIKRIRELGRKIPIVAVSAELAESSRERALECGADSFLRKPLTAEDLSEVVASLLVELPESGFRPEGLLKLVGGDRKAALAVIESYLGESEQLLEKLENADTGEELRSAAHTLLGATEIFGDSEFVRGLEHLEYQVEDGTFGPTKRVADDGRRFLEELRSFREELRDSQGAMEP